MERRRPESESTYWENARTRAERAAAQAQQLRAIDHELRELGRTSDGRPTGVLSAGDADIAYHYLGVAAGVTAACYSLIGTVAVLHGGGAALFDSVAARWAAGPAPALADVLLSGRTLAALTIQAVVWIVVVGTRRAPNGAHWTAQAISAVLTYAGWSGLLLAFAAAPLVSLSTVVPAALVGGLAGWVLLRIAHPTGVSRPLTIAAVGAGVLAGALGVTTLIHAIGLLLAWAADRLAHRTLIIG